MPAIEQAIFHDLKRLSYVVLLGTAFRKLTQVFFSKEANIVWSLLIKRLSEIILCPFSIPRLPTKTILTQAKEKVNIKNKCPFLLPEGGNDESSAK